MRRRAPPPLARSRRDHTKASSRRASAALSPEIARASRITASNSWSETSPSAAAARIATSTVTFAWTKAGRSGSTGAPPGATKSTMSAVVVSASPP